MARGVKPRWTIWRSPVCSGGSWLRMLSRWASIRSRFMCSLKRMIAVLAREEKTSGATDTALTSACRVTAQ